MSNILKTSIVNVTSMLAAFYFCSGAGAEGSRINIGPNPDLSQWDFAIDFIEIWINFNVPFVLSRLQ